MKLVYFFIGIAVGAAVMHFIQRETGEERFNRMTAEYRVWDEYSERARLAKQAAVERDRDRVINEGIAKIEREHQTYVCGSRNQIMCEGPSPSDAVDLGALSNADAIKFCQEHSDYTAAINWIKKHNSRPPPEEVWSADIRGACALAMKE